MGLFKFLLGVIILIVGLFGLALVILGTIGIQIGAYIQGLVFPVWPTVLWGILALILIFTGIYLTRT